MAIHSETDTVIKRILPYLVRRGYDVERDIDFETATKHPERYSKGYVDLLVTGGKSKPQFLIEAKRSSKSLTAKDAKQAIDYGTANKVPFVIVTNGRDIRAYNTKNKQPIRWDGQLTEKIPNKDQLPVVMRALNANADATDLPLGAGKSSLPFRPGLPLKQLNALFARCHSAIRKIEKNEETAFDDFSRLLFLKLLEEKSDTSDFELPYSYRFHELAERPESEADQVRDAIEQMIKTIREKTTFGSVIGARLNLKNAKTFRYIVAQLSAVSFHDSSLDSKGAAFEYFVRATLKGKKLGQYFTPRPVVQLASTLIGRKKIFGSLLSGEQPKVLDPACGTGGFLVYFMQEALDLAAEAKKDKLLTQAAYDTLCSKLKEHTFFGSDANESVASSAKMNMIIAGDGHTNIRAEDSLSKTAGNWAAAKQDCDIIIANPPFGTSETDSLGAADWKQYPLRLPKGQQLFLQKMVLATKAGGDICTVIDDGLLNTASSKELRKWMFQNTRIKAVVRLPEETFKPNKINVRSSVLLMEKREASDVDLDDEYDVTFIDVKSLGYHGSGEPIRGFDLNAMLSEIEKEALDKSGYGLRNGDQWAAFNVALKSFREDSYFRLDLKYWHPAAADVVEQLSKAGAMTVADINTIETRRGTSPKAETYVGEPDGFAAVIKAGTSITKYGNVVPSEDYIEKDVFDEMQAVSIEKGDVLISSTGTGTLGKVGVYDTDLPAIADGHVTIIRADQEKIDPFYLADYLRVGGGALQIERLYTGSTGLIELTPDDVKRIFIDTLDDDLTKQIEISKKLRLAEGAYQSSISGAEVTLETARAAFLGLS
ncbi:MAG TPA: type I restriction endonuclease subunit M [Octadecabacter sp.]|nr:type I restriction endonuclease subunit M [Octadecabacter sp.]